MIQEPLQDGDRAVAGAASPRRAAGGNRRAPTVLVADSSRHLRDIYATLLRYHGYRAVEAADSAEAVEVARRERPDAIVLEMDGPGLSGLEAARMLGEDPATAGTPLILLSLHTGVVYRRQARGAGSRGYLEKPFEPRRLLVEVERVLGPVPTLVAAD